MRTLFWGMNGVYTWTILEALLGAGTPIIAVLIDGSLAPLTKSDGAFAHLNPPVASDAELALMTPSDLYVQQNTINTAWRAGLPVYAIHDLNNIETRSLTASLQADVACVACFPRSLPATLLDLPRHGFLNVHPSLLPHYRGPAPLFWQLRDGVEPVGVTVHWMDEQFDTGDIAAQGSLSLPDGVDGPDADRLLGRLGGQLLAETLTELGDGTATRRPQPSDGSYQPTPRTADFHLDPAWSARHAFNFMRGTAEWGTPFSLIGPDGEVIAVRHAVSFSPQENLSAPYRIEGAQISIQFSPGVVTATLA